MEFASKLQEVTGKGYLSYSSIKESLKDMKLFELYMAGKLRKESDALRFGSMYDLMLFEPEKFQEQYFVIDDRQMLDEIGGKSPRSTKLYKQWLEEVKNTDKQTVTYDDWKKADEMVDRLKTCGVYDKFLQGTYQEEFNTFLQDIPVRGFYDCLGSAYVSDSKTTQNLEKFKYDVFSFGYDIQAYIYATVSGRKDFYWVAQEKSYPYGITVFHASEDTLSSGERKFWRAIELIKEWLFEDKQPIETFNFKTL